MSQPIPPEIAQQIRQLGNPLGAEPVGEWRPYLGLYVRDCHVKGGEMANPQQTYLGIDVLQGSDGGLRGPYISVERAEKLSTSDARELMERISTAIDDAEAYRLENSSTE